MDKVFASESLTDALLDRITHLVHILEMNGESYRLKQSRSRRRRPSNKRAPRLTPWVHRDLLHAGPRQPRGRRVAPRAGPSYGLRDKLIPKTAVHSCAAAPVHSPAAVDNDARLKCEAYRREYNEVRSHSSIGNKIPIELQKAAEQTSCPTV